MTLSRRSRTVLVVVLVVLAGDAIAAAWLAAYTDFFENLGADKAAVQVRQPPAAAPAQSASDASPGPVAATPFVPVYTTVRDSLVGDHRGPRYCARITLAAGLDRATVTANLEHALVATHARHKAAGETPSAVCVLAYRPSDDLEGAYTVGKGDYAPSGRWEDADASVPIERWRTSLQVSDEYFRQAGSPRIPVGATVTLTKKNLDKTPMPHGAVTLKAEFPDRPPAVATLPNGTKAQVLERRTYVVSDSMAFGYYRVRANRDGAAVEGWVPEAVCDSYDARVPKAEGASAGGRRPATK